MKQRQKVLQIVPDVLLMKTVTLKQSSVNVYDVDPKVEYTYTSKFQKLLDMCGNLWEDISRWADKKEVDK